MALSYITAVLDKTLQNSLVTCSSQVGPSQKDLLKCLPFLLFSIFLHYVLKHKVFNYKMAYFLTDCSIRKYQSIINLTTNRLAPY